MKGVGHRRGEGGRETRGSVHMHARKGYEISKCGISGFACVIWPQRSNTPPPLPPSLSLHLLPSQPSWFIKIIRPHIPSKHLVWNDLKKRCSIYFGVKMKVPSFSSPLRRKISVLYPRPPFCLFTCLFALRRECKTRPGVSLYENKCVSSCARSPFSTSNYTGAFNVFTVSVRHGDKARATLFGG